MNRFRLFLFLLFLVTVLFVAGRFSMAPALSESETTRVSPAVPDGAEDLFVTGVAGATGAEEEAELNLDNHQIGKFSPEMARLIAGIHAGRPVTLRVGETESRFLFRPKVVTTENFQISAGPDRAYPAAFEVFEGRQLLEDGSLVHQASLAVVNDAVSMAYITESGDYLVERGWDGVLRSQMLTSREEGSTWGHFVCVEGDRIAGVSDASGDSPEPPAMEASIGLAGEDEAVIPETEGALASHPFFRLGPQYDVSLKDINVLMVSGSTQTGPSSGLSSVAATYFTYAAQLGDIYERQLGLRYRLQEMVLIASDSGQDDVEYDDSVIPNDKNDGTDDLNAVHNWTNTHRPQATYKWGHVQAWTLANSDAGGTVGWAWIDSYGSSSFGFSVNEKRWNWGIIVHELGHNVGASHTNGGAMNPSVSRSNPQESFFTENQANGGFTAATDIYNYMSQPNVGFVKGPALLRNPLEMPFGVDDAVSTPAGTVITFNPLANDLTSTPLFGLPNNLRLVEVGQIFPKAAGSATISGDEITFIPAPGFTGNVWFSYTLAGDVGNGGLGWLHSADVVVTVGGSSVNPSQDPVISTTDDVVWTDFSGTIRINPLLNDEGKGRLWAGGVDVRSVINGAAEFFSEGAFHLVSATVINGNGTVSLETADVTRDSLIGTPENVQGNTGYLVYTPGLNEPAQVEIQYIVEDADGNQSTGTIFLDKTDAVSVASDLSTLIESQGRVVTITFTRTGPTTDSEWVEFRVTGSITLHGAQSDLALSGFDSFDPELGIGRVTIPAGQSAAELLVAAKNDAQNEGIETAIFIITAPESLLIDGSLNNVALEISDLDPIGTVITSEDFESFPAGTALASGWTNEATSPGVWTADSGGTPSSSTGPAADHTQGNASGVYLYREASSNTNQQADLTSPTIDLSGADRPILEFYYHMYGREMGELRVDVFSGGLWNLDVISPLIGQQQSDSNAAWARASVDVSAYKSPDFRVRFRGIIGSSSTSDMAIDDFAVGEMLLLAPESPVILGQPQSKILEEGDAAYISVVAQAFPAPTYQWKKNGVILPGVTQPVLYFASAQASDQGDYTCEVTSGSTVTSATATLTLPIPAPTGLSASQGGDSILLDWDDTLHPDFASYAVYRRVEGGSFGAALQLGLTVSAFKDDSVVDGVTYYYVMTASDIKSVESFFSEEVSITFDENLAPPVVDVGSDQSVKLVGGAAWTPEQITTTAWYDASDAETLTLSGSAVTAWADKSGNSLHLSSTVGREPTTGVNTINGTNALDFTNDEMATATNPFGASISDALVIAVHKVDNDANRGTLFTLSGSSTAANRWQVHAPFSGTAYFDSGGTSGGTRVSSDYQTNTGDNVLVAFYGSTTDSLQVIYKNGSVLKEDATGHTVTTVANIFVGSGADSSFQDTSLGEMIIINGTVTAEDRQNLEGYLAHKWGLEANLPTDHPHKASAPGGAGVVVSLDGTVSDGDGDSPTLLWTKVSGPGNVTFADATAVDTTVSFTDVGTYVLRLTADDGVYQRSDELTIFVRIDEDSDGIDDAWETAFFPGQEGTIDGSADSDSDGVLDFFEYLFGSDPTDAASLGFSLQAAVSNGRELVNWEIQEGFILGSDYRIERTTDLSDSNSWEELSSNDYNLSSVTTGGMMRLELEITTDFGNRVFLRLAKP